MTQMVYVQSPAAVATACHCCDCEDIGEGCFHDGQKAIEQHSEEYPEHQRITWLRREAA